MAAPHHLSQSPRMVYSEEFQRVACDGEHRKVEELQEQSKQAGGTGQVEEGELLWEIRW